MDSRMAMGVIVGNRGFFPDHLAKTGRDEIIEALTRNCIDPILLTPEDSKYGAIETRADARKCADLFKANKDRISGVIITLPNFGEERPMAETLRMADLDLPVLIQATPDSPELMSIKYRRDSFCGKMSICNNLTQYGIPYSLTAQHTIHPNSPEFDQDLTNFSAVCRIVKGLKGLRIGSIGARPAAFNTVRYSEKILESYGIAVDTVDLSEILGRIEKMKDDDPAAIAKLSQIMEYVPTQGVPREPLMKMAKLGAVIEGWMQETETNISAVQCWTALEEYFGVVPCTVMSMMSNNLLPSACEVDICGALAMYVLQLASGTPSALLDWNNNYGDDPDKAVCFHCSNLPKHFFEDVKMDFQEIIAGSVGKQNTYGTCVGRVKAGPMTFARLSTDDFSGMITGYCGEGTFTNDPLETFGGYGVVEIPAMQDLLQFICENGFEHHTAANLSSVAASVHEATTKYLDWDVYWHQ